MNVYINYKCNRNKNMICETKSFYILLVFLLITVALLIAVCIYCCLIKYKAKKKHLLPFYIANSQIDLLRMESKIELKETDIKNCTCYYFDDIIDDIFSEFMILILIIL